jgi:hypothetical protein
VTGTTTVHVGLRQFTVLAIEAIPPMIGGHRVRGRPAGDESSDACITLQRDNDRLTAGVHVAPRARFAGVAYRTTG